MKFFKKNASMEQAKVNQSRRFSLGQYIAAVSVMLVSVTALSYAAGILKLNSFQSQQVISAQAVNDNFDYVQTNLNVIAASMVSAASDVQTSNSNINTSISNVAATITAAAAADATTKANNAQATAIGTSFAAGQTWSNTSFAFGIPYQNTSTKAKMVTVVCANSSIGNYHGMVSTNGTTWIQMWQSVHLASTSIQLAAMVIVPPGNWFRIDSQNGTPVGVTWAVLE